jgi:hypothetical protein
MGFRETERSFRVSAASDEVRRLQRGYILIARQAMPLIADIDAEGIRRHGRILQWDPANARSRRRMATGRLGRVGLIPDMNRRLVPGSWEEYPFAATVSVQGPGSYVDKAPLHENWIQGGFIRAASIVQNFSQNDIIECHIV